MRHGRRTAVAVRAGSCPSRRHETGRIEHANGRLAQLLAPHDPHELLEQAVRGQLHDVKLAAAFGALLSDGSACRLVVDHRGDNGMVRHLEWTLSPARAAAGQVFQLSSTKPLDEWAKIFASEPDFFWSPINSIEDVVADEQFHAAGGVVYVPDDASSVPMVATPADFHGTPWEPRSAAPALGEHTDEILAELKTRRN